MQICTMYRENERTRGEDRAERDSKSTKDSVNKKLLVERESI